MVRPVPLLLLAACVSTDPADKDTAPTDDTDAPDSDDTDVDDETGEPDTEETADTGKPVVPDGCRAQPAAAKRARAVVVSFPYDAEGAKASTWEVLTLSPTGELARPGRTFTMGRATEGRVVFTPDGTLGLVAQEDGSLGIVALDAQGTPEVVEAGWRGGGVEAAFYASAVTVDPSGERAWVIDGNWQVNGGGLYEITLDCTTGAPTLVGRVLDTKLASALYPLPGGRAALVATEAGTKKGGHAFLLDGWPDDPVPSEAEPLFDYDGVLFGGSAVTPDGRFLIVGDNSLFADEPNRVAWARITGAAPEKGGELTLTDPYEMVVGPDGDAVLVASGFADALVALGHDRRATPAFFRLDALDYAGAFPALPGAMALVSRGPARGLVLVAENVAVRRTRFDGQGGVEDLGPFSLGDGLEAIPGAIGVQP